MCRRTAATRDDASATKLDVDCGPSNAQLRADLAQGLAKDTAGARVAAAGETDSKDRRQNTLDERAEPRLHPTHLGSGDG